MGYTLLGAALAPGASWRQWDRRDDPKRSRAQHLVSATSNRFRNPAWLRPRGNFQLGRAERREIPKTGQRPGSAGAKAQEKKGPAI